MYMPTPPDAIGVASEHNQLVSWYTSNEIQIFPLNYFSPFTLTPKATCMFSPLLTFLLTKTKWHFFLRFASSYHKQFMYFLGSIYQQHLHFTFCVSINSHINKHCRAFFPFFFFFRLATILGCVEHFIFINKLFCSLIIPTSLLIFNITAFKPLKWLHILKVAINAFSVTCCSVIFGFVFSLYCAT